LKSYPYADGIETTIDNLRLFQLEDDDMKPITNNDQILVTDLTYVVYEYFTKLPVDMYRTVPIDQLVNTVYTMKDCQWTELSPVFCFGFNKGEQGKNFYMSQTNTPRVKGVSLRCGDCTKHWDDGNPFEPSMNKKKGKFCISLEEMHGFLPAGENIKQSPFPELGITFSSLTHKDF
jgi:hypothetical protein